MICLPSILICSLKLSSRFIVVQHFLIEKLLRNYKNEVAFQDGHVDYHELPEYLQINKMLAEKYGLHCWTNIKSFDRDMPIKFLPIKWEKMLLKLHAAAKATLDKAITFEFSHFTSPHSCYPQAHGLFKQYCEYFTMTQELP
jgi:hypothetical protein